MTVFRFALLAGVLASLLTAAPVMANGINDAEKTVILSLQNQYRAQHCVPSLEWSDKLAADAQRWAEKCRFSHDETRGDIGENIAWGGERTEDSAVNAWYREVGEYDYSKPGFASGTAHFTQMIWKETKTIGCGVASCNLGTVRIWVCRMARRATGRAGILRTSPSAVNNAHRCGIPRATLIAAAQLHTFAAPQPRFPALSG